MASSCHWHQDWQFEDKVTAQPLAGTENLTAQGVREGATLRIRVQNGMGQLVPGAPTRSIRDALR